MTPCPICGEPCEDVSAMTHQFTTPDPLLGMVASMRFDRDSATPHSRANRLVFAATPEKP